VIIYTAFLKRTFNGCIQEISGLTTLNYENTCDDELEALVRSYYVVAFIKNFNELFTPLISPLIGMYKKWKLYKFDEGDSDSFKTLIRIEK